MKLNELKKPLDIGYIQFLPKTVRASGSGDMYCQILAYKDARVDMEILDKICAPENWQNKFRRDSNGVLQCGIGIYCPLQSDIPGTQNDLLRYDWVWKWSNGTPSDFEGVKGEYSDAFKRAGFMWGIGRELYNYPAIWVQLNDQEWTKRGEKPVTNYKFKPNEWKWEIEWEGNQVKKLVGSQKFGNTYKERFNSNPYKK